MKQQPHPNVVTLWRLQGGIRLLFPWLPASVGWALFGGDFVGQALAVVSSALLMGVLVLKVLIWPSLVYRFFAYEVREEELWIGRGVLFRRETVIPLSRIQHVDTRQGPMEQLFGLARILIYTASGRIPDGGIPGLEVGVASALRDQLARTAGKGDGV
jgi:membrane protein YdbS with pleckstrin-like domain